MITQRVSMGVRSAAEGHGNICSAKDGKHKVPAYLEEMQVAWESMLEPELEGIVFFSRNRDWMFMHSRSFLRQSVY